MNPDLRRRLLEKHGPEIDDWLQTEGSAELDGDDFDTASRQAELESLRAVDPSAGLGEEMTVRLLGEGANGTLDLEWNDVLEGVKRTVEKLSGGGLELAGLSSGSTVVHLRPTTGRDLRQQMAEGVDSAPLDGSKAETAATAFVQLLRAAESRDDVRPWADAMRGGFDLFVDALDKHDLDAQVAWWASSGQVRSAKITRSGRTYIKELRERTATEHHIPISGRVTELRESGHLRVKTGTSANSPSYDVHFENPSDLLERHLELGASVHLLVTVIQQKDRLGRPADARYEFLQFNPSQEGTRIARRPILSITTFRWRPASGRRTPAS